MVDFEKRNAEWDYPYLLYNKYSVRKLLTLQEFVHMT